MRALRRRGIYLLPNLFTTAALFFGFFAIVQAMNNRFEASAIAVFIAMVLDGLDGRVARLTHTQSEFGAQYDSLSDMVSFGAAPALIMYEWALKDLGKLGWIAAFVYCVGAALRLARFNTNIDVIDKRYFQGLPSPMAAALLAGLVWVFDDLGIDRELWLNVIAWLFTMFAGITMVTNVPFYSFKEINMKRAVPFWVVAVFAAGLAVVSLKPSVVLFLMVFAYAVSGYV
ncbi:MAG: CDP-diacylglycerol--serine O-phosphatidyltransferase, partial [Betaproteobacteria bacterium RBG_16_66_20]